MNAAASPLAPIPLTLSAAAPDLARRFGRILAALATLIAAAYLRHPTRAPLIVPLWSYLTRSARRFGHLMAHLAAARLPRRRLPRAPRPGRVRPHRAAFPTNFAWLVADLRHEAAAHALYLAAFLAEPAIADLLAVSPAAGRLFRPLCRMLGLPNPTSAATTTAVPDATHDPPEVRAVSPPAPSCPMPPPCPSPPCPRLRWPWRDPPHLRRLA